jgi:hypothetical protein
MKTEQFTIGRTWGLSKARVTVEVCREEWMSVVHLTPHPPVKKNLLKTKAKVAFDRLVTVWSKAFFP